MTKTSPRARGTKKRCPRCKKRRRFRGHKLSDRGHGPAWHRAEDGILVCYICHPENLLAVECPYTSCGSPAGIQCRNVRDGGFLEHGHYERGVVARAAAERGSGGGSP